MKASNIGRVSAGVVVVCVVCACFVFAQVEAKKPEIKIRNVAEQVALYTLHRGSYDKTGAAIGRLFQLVGEKGIKVTSGVSLAYLNNPRFVASERLLTEIRVGVDKESLGLAGQLGEFTDVKVLKAHKAAVAGKPAGMADRAPVYTALMTWMRKEGYEGLDGPYERFLDGPDKGEYAAMRTEISIPVTKAKAEEKD